VRGDSPRGSDLIGAASGAEKLVMQ